MKFKKEDIGLYLALGLMGGGIGLIVAAFLSSKLALKGVLVEREEPYEVVDDEEEEIKQEKKAIELTEEYEELIKEYSPTALQLQLLDKGLITKEAFIRMITEKDKFNSRLEEDALDEKPDLEELMPYIDDVRLGVFTDDNDNGEVASVIRYEVLIDPPEDKGSRRMRVVYYDPEDDSAYTMTRSKEPIMADVRTMMSQSTWDAVRGYLSDGLYSIVYVNDLRTTRYYRIELVPIDDAGND